ncbi:MAG: sigma-70 family RNA polymerase sigma factor [Thermosipho sp. (in: Bacteria)]|nr:sigma-70 family RNA polymerase sigma factor [Thermosipho sp. (in: thermotogales)]
MKRLLNDYLENNVITESLLLEIKNMILTVVSTNPGYKEILIGIFGNIDSALNELLNEIFIKLKLKKEILRDKIGNNLEGYLYILMKNHIIDVMRKNPINESLNRENKDDVEQIEYFKQTEEHYKPEWEIVAEAFVEELKKLNEEHLCYYLYKVMYSEEILFEEKTRNAKYKIVQRVKESLRELIKENGINDKEFALAIRIYMSEICEKIRTRSRKSS